MKVHINFQCYGYTPALEYVRPALMGDLICIPFRIVSFQEDVIQYNCSQTLLLLRVF